MSSMNISLKKAAPQNCTEIHQMQVTLYLAAARWALDTIKQEPKLRYLYEKMGYRPTGEERRLKDGMDLVYYAK